MAKLLSETPCYGAGPHLSIMPSLRVAQISDCHLFSDKDQCGYVDINPYHSLQRVLEAVKHAEPDMVLVTGDMLGEDSLDGYQHFQQIWDDIAIPAPFLILPGNHDVPDRLIEQFPHQSRWLYQGVSLGSWMFHGVDSHYRGTTGHVDEQQLQCLVRTIKQAPTCWHVVAVHHHPIAVDGWMKKHDWPNREQFWQALTGLEHIQAVLHGHLHIDRQWYYQSIPVMACPSTCWQFSMATDFSLAPEGPGYRLLTLADSGEIQTEIVRI